MRWTVLLATILGALLMVPKTAAAQAGDGSVEDQLAHKYAPRIVVKDQIDECDTTGEAYLPMSVEVVLGNPQVALRQVGAGDPVVTWGPTAADVAGLGEGFFLDFPGIALTPGCVYERGFAQYAADLEPTVYAHIVESPADGGTPARVYLQYWFYWYFNDWNNKHESDWEGIAVVFEADSVEAALATDPVGVAYSQHEGGETADWGSEKLQRDGDHPLVFPSAGSHASYYGSELWIGRSASEGVGCDNTSGPSTRYDPDVVVLPTTVDDPDDPLAWISFEGRWGERHGGPFNGPTGPNVKERWTDPNPWYEELRDASVAVPGGEETSGGLVETFCGVVGFGSNLLVSATVSPARLLVAVAGIAIALWFLAGRTSWLRGSAIPLVRRRRAGEIIVAAADMYRTKPLSFLALAALYLPMLLVVLIVSEALVALPIIGPPIELFLDISAIAGAQPGGGLSQQLAAFLLTGVAAAFLADPTSSDDPVLDAGRLAWRRRGALLLTWLRGGVIIALLALTVIGLPIAVVLAVRYVFSPQVVMVEGLWGRAAHVRSSALVRGRWWHTGLVSLIVIGLASGLSLLMSLALLFFVPSIPVNVTQVLAGGVFALVLPIASASLALLYGDAVASSQHVNSPGPSELTPSRL